MHVYTAIMPEFFAHPATRITKLLIFPPFSQQLSNQYRGPAAGITASCAYFSHAKTTQIWNNLDITQCLADPAGWY